MKQVLKVITRNLSLQADGPPSRICLFEDEEFIQCEGKLTYHSHTAIVTEHSEVPNWFEEVASTSYCNQSHSHYLLWGNFATQNKD